MILSGYQLMVKTFAAQRPFLQNVWPEIFPPSGLKAKSLVEISGAPGTGKSVLLYELMARALLSTSYGGKFCQVIFLDVSHKFEWEVFKQLVQSVMTENSMINTQQSNKTALAHCDSLIYLPCYSADQFESAFEEFEKLLWEFKSVSLIVIDGLDSFYWDECYNQLQRMNTHYKKLIKRLRSLCQEHNICCAYTVDASYISLKNKHFSYFPHLLIDYKLKLVKHRDGQFYLNDSRIKINCDGIKFL